MASVEDEDDPTSRPAHASKYNTTIYTTSEHNAIIDTTIALILKQHAKTDSVACQSAQWT